MSTDPTTPTTAGLTWREMVKAVRQELQITDLDADWVLWEATSFPFGSPEEVEQQARECVGGMS